MSEHTEKFRKLAMRLKEESAKIGMSLENFVIIPGMDDDVPDVVQAVFIVPDEDEPVAQHESVGDDPEQAKYDAAFQDIVGNFVQQTKKDEVEELKRQMQEDMRNGKGLFGD